MQHSDVETFFHEFGHLLHHVLGGHTRWAGISGVATEWDFVEAPSQMLEEWVWTPETLQTFARHYQTGRADSGRTRQADEGRRRVRQGALRPAADVLRRDQPRAPQPGSEGARHRARSSPSCRRSCTPFKFVDGTHFEESFTHLDGYSAIYYTYMWSLVIAKDMFTVFSKQGLLESAKPRALYRRTVLEPGGSKPAADLVKDFLGRPYTFEAYREWLNAN